MNPAPQPRRPPLPPGPPGKPGRWALAGAGARAHGAPATGVTSSAARATFGKGAPVRGSPLRGLDRFLPVPAGRMRGRRAMCSKASSVGWATMTRRRRSAPGATRYAAAPSARAPSLSTSIIRSRHPATSPSAGAACKVARARPRQRSSGGPPAAASRRKVRQVSAVIHWLASSRVRGPPQAPLPRLQPPTLTRRRHPPLWPNQDRHRSQSRFRSRWLLASLS